MALVRPRQRHTSPNTWKGYTYESAWSPKYSDLHLTEAEDTKEEDPWSVRKRNRIFYTPRGGCPVRDAQGIPGIPWDCS